MVQNVIFGFNYFRFSSRKTQNQRKLAKTITHFTIQFCSKNLTHLTDLNSLNIVKIILCNTGKNITHLISSPANMFLVCVGKKYLHCIIFKRPKTRFLKHLEIKWLYIPVNFCEKILFQRVRKLLSGGLVGWVGWWLNNFLKEAHCLVLVKCFTNFYFN